jgi:hypothetical protein
MYSITVSAAFPRSAPQSARRLDQVRERIPASPTIGEVRRMLERMAGEFATHPLDRLAAHA